MPAQKLPPEVKKEKNLQTRVDVEYYGRVLALSEALGYPHVADFLRDLVDEALENAHQKIAKRQEELRKSHEVKAARVAELAAKAVAPSQRR